MQQTSDSNLIKIPESTLFVRFQDCDALGHLNNVRFFDYFLNTREGHVRQYYNLNLMELARQEKANWVISNHHIAYLRSADLGEPIIIQTKLIHFDNTTLVIEGTMLNEKRTKLKSLLWSTMRYVSMETGKPTDHPDTIMDMLEKLDAEDIDYDPDGFQDRIKLLSKQLKKEAGD